MNRYKWAWVIILFAFLAQIDIYNYTAAWQSRGALPPGADGLDFWFEAFKGGEYTREIPVAWLMTQLYLAFLLGNYPINDLVENSPYVFTRIGSRNGWWFSKTMWVGVNVLVYYLLAFATVGLVTALQFPLTVAWSPYAKQKILPLMQVSVDPLLFLSQLFILLVTTSITLSLLQMSLSLFLKPFYSYMVIAALCMASVFFFTPALPGTHSMMLRHALFAPSHGLTFGKSLLYNTMVSMLFFLGGWAAFRKKDLYGAENTE